MPARIQELNSSAQLEHVLDGVFDHQIDPAYLSSFLSCPRHKMYIAVDNEKVVGMVSGVEYFHSDKAPQMWINEVGVAPQYRRRKIGRRLIQAIIEYAGTNNCSYVWLGTDADNKAAQACFNAVPDGEPSQPFLLYEWDLED